MALANVLIIGQGGREHALGWKIAQSPHVGQVFYAPGNAGTEIENKGINIGIDGTDKDRFEDIGLFIRGEKIDLTVVGPEDPLAKGIVNYLVPRINGSRVFGPTENASLLEADKFISYDVMDARGIPQAYSIKCFKPEHVEQAITRIKEMFDGSFVIKARGLHAGKGVKVCDQDQGFEDVRKHLEKYGNHYLVARRFYGQEFSVFAISDGERVSALEIAVQDHKPLLDGDKGPNTGGMGAYCPATHVASVDDVKYVTEKIMTPVIHEMKERGWEYKGFLYAGMIRTGPGTDGLKVIEFNVRMGDPECQPAMMMLESDLYETLIHACDGELDKINFKFKLGAACCVAMASKGYPGAYQRGLPIEGIEKADAIDGVKVFHAGTGKGTGAHEGKVVTAGGRVLGVTGYSPDGLQVARDLAYRGVGEIGIPGRDDGLYSRGDIGSKGLLAV
jgi:phosphoribosylamine--glycine ligase